MMYYIEQFVRNSIIGADPNSRSLETVATLALETGMKDKVTASHTTAMGCYNDAYMYKLMRLLKMADLNFIANPLVNLFLGGVLIPIPNAAVSPGSRN